MKTSFDQQIKDVWETGEFPYKPENWERMKAHMVASSMKKSDAKKMAMWATLPWKRLLAAASLLGVIVASYFLTRTTTQPRISLKPSTKPPSKVSSPMPAPTQQILPSVLTNSVVKQYSSSSTLPSSHKAKTVPVSKINFPIPQPTAFELTPKSSETEQIVSTQEHSTKETKNLPAPTPTQVLVKNADVIEKIVPPSIDFDFLPRQTKVRSGFGVIGSVGLGQQNAAYAAGIQYTGAVSKHLFVSGALSLSSSSIQDVAIFQPTDASTLSAQYGNSTGGLVPGTFDAKTVDVKLQSMNYAHLNFNPSFGWQVSSLISLKAGFDIQQQVSNTQQLSYISKSNLYRPLPSTDVGLTPQVGIRLTPHIQSSFIYRRGINSALFKKDYYERNYVQLQVGYNF